MKKCLIIAYSQIGQTKKAVDLFEKSISRQFKTDRIEIKPKQKFSFPWKLIEFFRIFPECVNGIGTPIEALPESVLETDYDLIILGYQIWFLSTSLPMQSLLKDPTFAKLVRNKNILGLITARNMWVSGVRKTNKSLVDLGVNSIENFVLCDTAPDWATFVTTPRWMLTGKKEAFWIFPEAGVSEESFQEVTRYGAEITKNKSESEVNITEFSHRQHLVPLLMEFIGIRVFGFWAWFIGKFSSPNCHFRDLLLLFFRLNLVVLILVILPLMTLLKPILTGLLQNKLDEIVDKTLKVSQR